MARAKTWGVLAAALLVLVGGGVALRLWVFADDEAAGSRDSGPVPVEVAAVEVGAIERSREFTGTLEASAEFTVAPKVGGRVQKVHVDLADVVERGAVVAELDDEELAQDVAQARAELAVAQARVRAADKLVEVARRNFQRVEGLSQRDISSAQELDGARSEKAEAEAGLEVARAEVTRARANLKAAEIRRGYTQVRADWESGDDTRLVAARLADEGTMIAANQALLRIVDLDPLTVVVFATEVDYAQLEPGMAVRLRTDAFPGESFPGEISRIAPVFRSETRQARVEMRAPNGDGRLKPGMFVRAEVELETLADATIVPASAVVERGGEAVVFEVDQSGERVRMRPVELRLRSGDRAAVAVREGEALRGPVVTLGQQQLVDGDAIVIPERRAVDGEGAT